MDLFQIIPAPCLILDIDAPRFTILDVNDSYLSATNTKRKALIGNELFKVFPDRSDDPNDDGVVSLTKSLNWVIKSGKQHQMGVQKYDIPEAKSAKFISKYWQPINTPILDNNGALIAIIHKVIDVTDVVKKNNYINLMLENTDEGFLLIDLDLNLIGFNTKFESDFKEAFGIQIEIGKSILEYAQESRKEKVKQIYQQVFKGETISNILPATYSDGTQRIFELHYKPARDFRQEINGAFVSITEITEHLKIEQERKNVLFNLQERNKEILCLYKINNLQNKELDVNQLLSDAVNLIPSGFVDENRTHSRITYNKQLFKSNKFKSSKKSMNVTRSGDTSGEIKIEVFFDDVDLKPSPFTFLEEEKSLLESIAENLTLKLDHIISQRIIDQQNHQLQNILNSSLDVICTIDKSGKFASIGNACKELWGYNSEELIGTPFMDLVHPEDHGLTQKVSDEIMRGISKTNFENRYIRKDGTVIPIVWSAKWDFNDELMYCVARDATEKQAVEKAIADEKERYELVAKSTYDAIWDWDTQNETVLWGDGFERVFGHNISTSQEDDNSWTKRIHPDDVERVTKKIYSYVGGTEEFWNDDYRFIKADGSYARVNDNGIIVRNESGKAIRMVGAMRDVTERVELEQLLEKMYRLAKIGVWELDIEKSNLIWSDVTKEIHEVEPDFKPDLENAIEFYKKGEFRESIFKFVTNLIEKNEAFNEEFIIVTQKGKEKWVRVIGEAEFIGGKCKKILGSTQDIHESKLTAEKIKELNRELQDQAQKLTRSNEELEQFAYIASHDLQEPLRMVTSFLSQLEKRYNDFLDEKGKQYIYFAVDGAKRMREIILDLLEYSRIGRSDTDKVNTDLNEVVESTIKLLSATMQEKKAVVNVQSLPTLSVYPVAIQQVFQNLISNALKYQREGVPPEIYIHVNKKDDNWEFGISDNGIGISSEYFERVFVIFQRLHTKTEYSGTGMGLTICKKVIEQHGGKIWVKNNKNNGSTFYFTLPDN